MKKILLVLSISVSILSLSACSSGPNVTLKPDFWQTPHQTVAVGRTQTTSPRLYKDGPQGLLDAVINDAATQQLTQYMSHLSLSPFYSINHEIAARLHSKNIQTINPSFVINLKSVPASHQNTSQFAKNDFTIYSHLLKNDKLLMISIDKVGAIRRYYGVIPLGSPQAYCIAEGQLVDTHSNQILWRHKTVVTIHVDGQWDNPPHYPAFTQAYQQALTLAKTNLINDFLINSH